MAHTVHNHDDDEDDDDESAGLVLNSDCDMGRGTMRRCSICNMHHLFYSCATMERQYDVWTFECSMQFRTTDDEYESGLSQVLCLSFSMHFEAGQRLGPKPYSPYQTE
jgi:hypothetical protein